ncbi:MAG: SpoIIE family protein phosphatase [Pirellulales bacterium]
MPVLQVVNGIPPMAPGRIVPVEGDRAVLGRHPECDIVLDVAAVSRQHARIIREVDEYFLEDLESRNGTFLNGQEVQGRQALRDGDRVIICDLTFRFCIDAPAAPMGSSGLSGGTSMPLLVEDDDTGAVSGSSVMSKLDLSSSSGGVLISVKPEVKLQAVLEIARNLGRALSLDEVLSKLLDSLFKIFVQADRGFVVLQFDPDEPLAPKAVKYRRPDDDRSARISRTIIRQAMEAREAILSADAVSDDRFELAESIADFHIRSMMCAPLIASDQRPLGVLQIDTLNQRSRFTEEDLEVLASIASQAAVAVENAQLHDQALKQRALHRDLELAHRVQQGFIPSELPRLPGYHFFHYYVAANQVGGDYFDYVRLSGDRLAVVVADVSGKGVAAALLMAKLSGEVRYRLAHEPDLAQAVGQINASMTRRDWEDRFVTFAVAVIDPKGDQLAVVNAGHMAPLLRRACGTVETIGEEGAGLPLGVIDDGQYVTTRHHLAPGDCVALFTDGISEAMNAEGALYGLQRLATQFRDIPVSATHAGEHLLEDVRRFVAAYPQSDDMCLVCFGPDSNGAGR